MTARGIKEWCDITHPRGRWLVWKEVETRYWGDGAATAADKAVYERMIRELGEARWDAARTRWMDMVTAGRTAAGEEMEDDSAGCGVVDVKAARRTAACHGGWEYLVEWEGGERTWEPHENLERNGGRKAHVKRMTERAKESRVVPESMYRRIMGVAAPAVAGVEVAWRDAGGITAAVWQKAVTGDLRKEDVKRAVSHMWKVFLTHAKEVHGVGRVAAEFCCGSVLVAR